MVALPDRGVRGCLAMALRSSNSRVNQFEWGNSIGFMPKIVGSTLLFNYSILNWGRINKTALLSLDCRTKL